MSESRCEDGELKLAVPKMMRLWDGGEWAHETERHAS